MKQTRTIKISEKVFSGDDLKRIAGIFERQASLARKSGHHSNVDYAVTFSDDTTFQSDSPEVFSDETLVVPRRPVAIQMWFLNYTLGRNISISLAHGDSSYRNTASISGNEPEWVNQNFLALKEAIDAVQPQDFWFKRHKFVLLNLFART